VNFSNSHHHELLSKTPEIKEKNVVDEKLKVLSMIFKSESKKLEPEKPSENIQKNNEDGNKNKKMNSLQDKKSFSILNLLNIATQVNCLFMIDNEFDLCKAYYNLVKVTIKDNNKL
jgi:hypothetical protein